MKLVNKTSRTIRIMDVDGNVVKLKKSQTPAFLEYVDDWAGVCTTEDGNFKVGRQGIIKHNIPKEGRPCIVEKEVALLHPGRAKMFYMDKSSVVRVKGKRVYTTLIDA